MAPAIMISANIFMKDMKMDFKLFAAASIIAMTSTGIFALNGKAVTVVSYVVAPNLVPVLSRLIVCNIAGKAVVSTDTIVRGGNMYQPTWSFDGKHIAFFKNGTGLCVINPNGDSLRTLARTDDWPDPFGKPPAFICWPGADDGKWIYYHRSCSSCPTRGSGEIWKVNFLDSTQKSLVCDYTKTNNTVGGFTSGFERFSLSADAKYCVSMTIDFDHPEITGYAQGICPHTFPPQGSPTSPNPWLTSPTCIPTGQFCGKGGCNSGICPSGKVTYYFDGSHDQLRANFWDHAAKTLTTYTIGSDIQGSLGIFKDIENWLVPTVPMPGTFAYPRGSSNSDRIVVVIANYNNMEHYSWGGNTLVVANWKEKEAVLAVNNPDNLHASGWTGGAMPDGLKYWYNENGDFWVAGGPAGCYQDIGGNWIDVKTGQAVHTIGGMDSRIVNARQSILHGTIALYNLKGVHIGDFRAASMSQLVSARLVRGTCVARGFGAPAKIITIQTTQKIATGARLF
jgi:hypothetical protein